MNWLSSLVDHSNYLHLFLLQLLILVSVMGIFFCIEKLLTSDMELFYIVDMQEKYGL